MKINGNSWGEAKQIEVATAHSMGLKAPMITAATGVPAQTIRHWRTMDWFKDLVSEIQREDDTEVDAKLTKIVNKSLDNVVDRLENGDFMYDPKAKTFRRRPVFLRDVTRVAEVMYDKRNLLRGKPTSISGKQEQITDRLSKLALEFEKFCSTKVVEGEVLDARITREVAVTEVTTAKEEVNAIPITTPTQVDVLKEASDGKEMGI